MINRARGNPAWGLIPAALLAAIAFAASASGQAPEPDTEFTPVPKPVPEEGGEWLYVGGAKFGETNVPDKSATPYTVDFFGTAFANETHGAFVGAQCTNPDTPFEDLDTCERVPAIYEYSDVPGQPPIRQVLGPEATGESEPGYVASVTWIDAGHAIAVGGSGHYPRRELPREQDENDAEYTARDLAGTDPNAAGRARAWLVDRDRFGDTGWHEIDVPSDADGNPAHGLTAVDCSPRPADGNLCIAGGMRQLWVIKDGSFVESFTPTSKNAGKPTVEKGSEWRFRVRSVSFVPGESIPPGSPAAVAVTSGCCAESQLGNSPRVLVYDGRNWYVRLLAYSDSGQENPGRDSTVESVAGVRPTGTLESTQRSLRPQSLPGSYYALSFSDWSGGITGTIVATPGGAPPDQDDPLGEPASRLIKLRPGLPGSEATLANAALGVVIGGTLPCRPEPHVGSGAGVSYDSDLSGNLCGELANPNLSDLRLVAGDGDFDRPPISNVFQTNSSKASDGLMDWAVGSLYSTGPGHDDRAAAYTTTRRGNLTPNPLDCTLDLNFTVDCKPREVDEIRADTESQSLYALPTYALNAFAFTPQGSVGWAAGDKGAILRLGGSGTVASQSGEPAPPRLGARRTEPLPDTGPYEVARPQPASAVGEVPTLGERPTEELAEPELVPAGAPDASRSGASDSVRSIVMSRDGSEGWALGGDATKGAQGTIFHYDGGRWRRCETSGIPGQTEPDPACADLAFLHKDNPVQLTAAARVPLERDADPTNDDVFELVAVGTRYKSPGDGVLRWVVLRYREGRWSVEEDAMREIDPTGAPAGRSNSLNAIVFTAPDDGWIMSGVQSGAFLGLKLYHFDGDRWLDCGTSVAARSACGDSGGVLPLGQTSQPFILTAAGTRVYLAGTRTVAGSTYPVILSLEATAEDPEWVAEYDPGCPDPESGQCVPSGDRSGRGLISAFSVAPDIDGRYLGWAAGLFGPSVVSDSDESRRIGAGSDAALLRLTYNDGGEPSWRPYSTDDAADDYLFAVSTPPQLLSTISEDGRERSFLAPGRLGEHPAAHPMLSFGATGSAGQERWRVFPTPFALSSLRDSHRWNALAANVQAMAPDGEGGLWLAARRAPTTGDKNVFFYHYTDRRPTPVFEDVSHPIREAITDAAGTADGQLWVSTEAGVVYRYDRLTGWDRLRIPGWDPGQVVARTSPANAIALGPDGSGVVVGGGGRIANLGPGGVKLDRAAGAPLCAPEDPIPPCGTGRSFYSAAVAPDGSAMVGGEGRALLFRPAGGEFHAISKPLAAVNASFTGIAMPSPDQAWISTNAGQVFAGTRAGEDWSWRLESVNADGDLVTLDAVRQGIPLNAIAVDASGHGYAVGDQGLMLERTPGAGQPWSRMDSGLRENLYSVALPEGEGSGALIGGELGLVLTLREGRIEVARTGEFTDPVIAGSSVQLTARVVGLALLPGYEPGQVEAWAVSQATASAHRSPAPGAILHYTNAPDEPLLSPGGRASPLTDAPAPPPDALSFAAFGRSDCDLNSMSCIEPQGTNFTNEAATRGILSELEVEAGESDGVDFALFTGDVDTAAGREGQTSTLGQPSSTPLDADIMHRRWVELVADSFAQVGIPLYGTIGVQDLSQAKTCPPLTFGRCFSTRQVGLGTTEPWRESFAEQAAPWGSGGEASRGSLSFETTPGQGGLVEPEELTGEEKGARTHYAVDIERNGELLARLVVLDNSLRSLAISDAQQNPIEVQTDFLQRMLCYRDSGGDCSRQRGQEAIVMANTPTYSYEPSASGGGTETATDAATFETLLLQGDADLLITGRLGWNGLYYTLAPGLHCPSLGGEHPDGAKSPSQSAAAASCDEGAQEVLEQLQRQPDSGAVEQVNEIAGGTPAGVLPTLVASGAGGTFGPVNNPVDGPASRGFWHGYSVVHLDTESGDVRVEQRPVFDWIGINSDTHEVEPRARVALHGYGREVAGADTPLRYDEIDSHAITHRYDLLLADPEEPWLPCMAEDTGCEALHARLSGDPKSGSGLAIAHSSASSATRDQPGARLQDLTPTAAGEENPCDPYLCLPERIGTIDRTNGEVRAGDGRYPDTFALALLSVGEKAATWPLAFLKSPSFTVQPVHLTAPLPNAPAPAPNPQQPPAPPSPPQPNVPQPSVPEVPPPPAVPPIAAASPPEPQPPAPPAPPPPTEQPSPLSLTLAPPGTAIATPTAVIQPPTPPVNPAPPGGARREARQRQAAAQKSGADAESEDATGEGGVDSRKASGPVNLIDSVQEARRYEDRRQPSAWAREALSGRGEQPIASAPLYVGSLALMALVLSLGWTRARPTPRRREPRLPAPAWNSRRWPW